MGCYTNYEILINENINWDEDIVNQYLCKFNCKWLYLRDMRENIIIFSIYSTHEITDIVKILNKIYNADVIYKRYGDETWIN